MKPLVWVTGAGGLIGSWIVKTAALYGQAFQIRGLTRADLELTDFKAVDAEFDRQTPAAIIHCAALSRSPDCQAHPAMARQLNVEVTRHLAALASNIPFLFFSTDLVFDGRQGAYEETAPVNPLSVYAETKVEAEEIIKGNPRHIIVRTSLNGGPSPTGDRGFDEQMKNAWAQQKTLDLFTDEFRSPMGAEVTARGVWDLLQSKRIGLFHLAGAERLSRWQIGEILSNYCKDVEARIRPGTIKNWTGAPRPPDTSLNCDKIQKVLSFPLPKWSEWIRSEIRRYG